MAQPMTLTSRIGRDSWIDAFSMRLGELLPTLDPSAADSCAVQTFDDAADLDPGEAAAIFALELPPLDGGCPGD